MTIVSYYFDQCPDCQNAALALVRNASLQESAKAELTGRVLDEKYIPVLPDIWGEDAKMLGKQGAVVPFLYNPDTQQFLNVDMDSKTVYEDVFAFVHFAYTGEVLGDKENAIS